MANDIRAMVQTAANELELQNFPGPQTGDDLLRIEACGTCGTDVETLPVSACCLFELKSL